jgi:uncharacterized protein DUF1259
MTKASDGNQVLMGDLVLLQDEVNPVMSALLDNGLDVTALHNHFFWDEPHMFYMHVHGHGSTVDLARKLKPAVDLIGKQSPAVSAPASAPAAAAQASPLNTARLAQIVGQAGEQTGAVYKITIGRSDLTVTEMGATITARMGLNTWAAFVGSDDKAAIAGDVAMLEPEVTPVLQGTSKEWARRRGDPSPHDERASDDHLPALLGHRPGAEAGGRLQGRPRSDRQGREITD